MLHNAGIPCSNWKHAEPIAVREPLKLKSFFVLAPDDVLVEVVEAPPIPEAAWRELPLPPPRDRQADPPTGSAR